MDELSRLRGSEGYEVSSDDSRKKIPVNQLAGFCQNAFGALRHGRSLISMKTVTIYTDGACSGNPGPGGCSGKAANLSHRENAAAGGKRGSLRSHLSAATKGVES